MAVEDSYWWSRLIEPWEIHPALNHLPIAFLLAGVALDLYGWWCGQPGAHFAATRLLVGGVITGVLAALAGVLAFFTVPGHTDEAHQLMYLHAGIQAAAMILFAWLAWTRWWNWAAPPTVSARIVACLAATVLLIGSGAGGYLVYHGGVGVDPEILAPELRHGHSHGIGSDDTPEPQVAAPKRSNTQ